MRTLFAIAILATVGCGNEKRNDDRPVPLPQLPDSPDVNDSKSYLPPSTTISTELSKILGISLSPDGRIVGAISSEYVRNTSSFEYLTYFFDASTGEPVGTPVKEKGIGQYSFDGKLGIFRKDDEFTIYEIATGKTVAKPKLRGSSLYSFSASGKELAVADGMSLGFFDSHEGMPLRPAIVLPSEILALSAIFAKDTRIGTLHIDAQDGAVVTIWECATGLERDRITLNRGKLGPLSRESLRIAEDGKTMIEDGTGMNAAWDLETKASVPAVLKPNAQWSYPISGSRYCYRHAATTNMVPKRGESSSNHFFAVADTASGKLVHLLHFPKMEIINYTENAASSHDGKRIASYDVAQRKIFVWNLP